MRTPTTARKPRRLMAVAAVAIVGILLAGCSDDSDSDGSTAKDPAPTSAADEPGALPDWAPKVITDENNDVTGLDFSEVGEPSAELQIAEVTTGTGAPVEQGQTITADYFGQLADADAPFDESFSGEPFQAPIGVGSLIPGWDQGLVGLPVGTRVVMSIPPELGYGDGGSGPIPGGATLYFVVDIIDAQ
jgi:FKBP-type peptidyl-prolyl isomerase-like protein